MSKIYKILLDSKTIGTSVLEHADPPMGIVFGKINFSDASFNFDFFKEYCKDKSIGADIYPEEKLINTRTIPDLKVFNDVGTEISALGCNISGMDSDEFTLTIEGIPADFFEKEFPDHFQKYYS